MMLQVVLPALARAPVHSMPAWVILVLAVHTTWVAPEKPIPCQPHGVPA